jgi:uncharacterized protein YcbX
MTTIGTVASVHCFPVKSMQGEAPASVAVDENGVVGDRTWALRDTETGKLASAKRPRLWRPLLDCRATGVGDDVVVTLPSGERYGIGEAGLPIDLEALLGRSVAIEAATGPQQGVYESDWPELEGITLAGEVDFPTNLTGEGTSFVDLGILHLLTTTSMGDFDVRRFRPSILIDTPDLAGFPENEWSGRTMTIGAGDDAVVLSIGDPAPRCVMTTVAQGDLPRDPGVLRTIAADNKVTNVLGTFACLGCYARVETGGTVSVGAPVSLT